MYTICNTMRLVYAWKLISSVLCYSISNNLKRNETHDLPATRAVTRTAPSGGYLAPNSAYSRSRLNTHSALPACHPLYVIRVELTQCTVSNENKQTNKQQLTLARSQKSYVVSSIYERHSPWTETVLECILFLVYWFLLPRPIAYLKNNTSFTVWYQQEC